VNCARSVIELITLYWPCSIDALQPERAIVDGFPPTFFDGRENVRLLQWSGRQELNVVNRLIWKRHQLGMAEARLSSSVRTIVRHFVHNFLFCTNPFPSGILVRNDATKHRLEQRFRRNIIMSGPTFLRQPVS